jgi:type I restriction enzyme M protein
MAKWTLEDNVNDWVKSQLIRIGLKNGETFGVESSMSDKLKAALKGGAKTALKTGTGKPDFHVEGYEIPVLIENKLGSNKLIASTGTELKMDEKSVQSYAVNGAVSYAQTVLASKLYEEAIAIGISGDDENSVEIKVYYVFSTGVEPKLLVDVTSLDFLESKTSFNEVINKAKLTDSERHNILIGSRKALQQQAKSLNKLMNNHSINVEQRVVYVSGCILAMQSVIDEEGNVLKEGLTPASLNGSKSETERDGKKIVANIKEYFEKVNIPADRMDLLVSTFSNAISTDSDRDELIDIDKEVGKLLSVKSSLNKQVFTFIYENVYSAIDATSGHLDIMGEMYSEFLKYAVGDGKDIGIVLTPPYVTKMMVEILGIDEDSKVMDLATGSAGFLISAMAEMINKVEKKYGKGTSQANAKIKKLQKEQLLGVELDAKMFALATTNMLLRGDSSTNIQKGSSFDRPAALYEKFGATRLLLNPPFSYDGNGMPFIEFGLDHMEKGGYGAIIVQDSAGSGKAANINKSILKKHTLVASIKMATDLFQPNAGVQTSIYVFLAGTPHDFDKVVKFIDFRKDGYKRAGRGLSEIDHPTERYQDIIKIYKAGTKANLPDEHKPLWNLEEVYVEDQITNSGADWNFEQHQKHDTTPTHEDFMKTVGDYLTWEVSQLLNGGKTND